MRTRESILRLEEMGCLKSITTDERVELRKLRETLVARIAVIDAALARHKPAAPGAVPPTPAPAGQLFSKSPHAS